MEKEPISTIENQESQKQILLVPEGTRVTKETAEKYTVCSQRNLAEIINKQYAGRNVLLSAEEYKIYPGPLGPEGTIETIDIE